MITNSELGTKGRLGNMLFQMAVLIAISDKKGYPIKVSQFAFDRIGLCNTKWDIYPDGEEKNLPHKYEQKGPSTGFDPDVFEQPDNTDYSGYYCSARYFDHCQDRVYDSLRFNDSWTQQGKDIVKHYQQGRFDIVAVHVRRTDYLGLTHLFSACPVEYYTRAMRRFSPHTHRFLVFSDDIPWCKENIHGENIMFSEGYNAHEDLCVMSQCHHFIIANSTFSWWAAWFSRNPSKMVITPKEWFPPDNPNGLSEDAYRVDGWIEQ